MNWAYEILRVRWAAQCAAMHKHGMLSTGPRWTQGKGWIEVKLAFGLVNTDLMWRKRLYLLFKAGTNG